MTLYQKVKGFQQPITLIKNNGEHFHSNVSPTNVFKLLETAGVISKVNGISTNQMNLLIATISLCFEILRWSTVDLEPNA